MQIIERVYTILKMGAALLLVILMISIDRNLVLAGECELPGSTKAIDWAELRRISDKWFEILYADNPLDGNGDCYTITNIEPTEDGTKLDFVHFTTRAIDPNGDMDQQKIRIHISATNLKLGQYQWTKGKDSLNWLNRKFGNMAEELKGEEEVEELYSHRHVYVTDYKTYLIEMVCGNGETKFMSIYSPIQNPTAELMLNIRNTLTSLECDWSRLALRLTNCHTQ